MREGFIEDDYCSMWIEDGIGFMVYKPNLELTLEIAKKMVADRVKSFNGTARPVFVDIRNLVSVDSLARKYMAGQAASELITAGAILVGNPLAKWAGNIFMMIDQPITRAKLFTDKEKALQWLQQFKYLN